MLTQLYFLLCIMRTSHLLASGNVRPVFPFMATCQRDSADRGVDLATARREARGNLPAQKPLNANLGDLGCFDPAWAGWRLSRGLLISPEGWEATPGHCAP